MPSSIEAEQKGRKIAGGVSDKVSARRLPEENIQRPSTEKFS